MGRPTRIQYPGACYHVVLKGNNRDPLFETDADREHFLSLLEAHKQRYQLRVYAYALLPGAIHLVLETAQPNLSRAMQAFNTRYTKYFNKAHQRAGHVLGGRYRAYLVDKGEYLAELTRYVHLSPLREGLAQRPWRFVWSSCAAYVESELKQNLVDTGPVLRTFGKTRLPASVRYLQFLKDKMKGRLEYSLPIQKGGFVGGPEFAVQASGQDVEDRRSGYIDRILAEVTEKHGADRESLFGRSQRRRLAVARREAIYRAWKEAGLGLTEIGRIFGRSPSAVCQLIQAVEAA
jgi:REP element-mobilizing transposase RayT